MSRRLIVLLTGSPHDFGELTEGRMRNIRCGTVFIDCNDSMEFNVEPLKTDRLVCVIKIPYEENALRAGIEDNTEKLREALQSCSDYEEKVVGVHWGFVEDVLDINEFQSIKITPYSTNELNSARELCSELAKESPDLKTVQEHFDALFESLRNPILKPVLKLKHRIAHLWLPLDIDLQGIIEVNREDIQEEYFKSVLEDKNGRWYRSKLEELQFMMVRSVELIKDHKARLEKEWKTLLNLCGLRLKEERENLFDPDSLELNDNSPIFQFMSLLDKRICDKKYDEISEILEFFARLNMGNGWKIKVKENKEVSIDSFHIWFSLLEETLGDLVNILRGRPT